MAFPKSRILSTQQLVRQINESNRNGERFCFILGSGASVESGIPSGNTLEMRWMDCIMGEADDLETPAMDPKVMRQYANNLYAEKLIEHSFEEIESAWRQAKEDGKSISSAYYFDIYKLRFYPNQRNGYRYLERIMESCEPSIGYHTLALLLASSTRNNLVITTNFDSLVEDALFLYTEKKPLVVGHESLAGYIESDIQRPIIAKVHRGLMYAPFNSPDTTNKLKEEWREALNYAFGTYTPVVIGYGGGDHSLMAFLQEESTVMRHGIYWCFRNASGLPEGNLQTFVLQKDGYFVNIGGFDALMLEIGNSLYKEEITPTGTDIYLQNQYKKRVAQYNSQWIELNKKPQLQGVLQLINEAEQEEEKKREVKSELTTWDYIRRGDRAYDEGDFERALAEYGKAMEHDPSNAVPYNNRGYLYDDLKEYEKAIEDYTKAIEIDQDYAAAYSNRGASYYELKQHEQAVEDCRKAIELEPNNPTFYNNLGTIYYELNKREKAIEQYTKAIEIDPNDADFYNNRGTAYFEAGDCERSIEDFSKAIQINPDKRKYYQRRAEAYRAIGDEINAEADEKVAEELQEED